MDDLKWFTKTMGRVIGEECGEMYVSYVDDTHYFVDFLRYSKELYSVTPPISLVVFYQFFLSILITLVQCASSLLVIVVCVCV